MLLKQYVRNRKKQKCGVLLGFVQDGHLRLGWSRCALRKNGSACDRFDRERGTEIALARATKGIDWSKIPHSMHKDITDFMGRCCAYFKLLNMSTPTKLQAIEK